jgi:hypothetical protein
MDARSTLAAGAMAARPRMMAFNDSVRPNMARQSPAFRTAHEAFNCRQNARLL